MFKVEKFPENWAIVQGELATVKSRIGDITHKKSYWRSAVRRLEVVVALLKRVSSRDVIKIHEDNLAVARHVFGLSKNDVLDLHSATEKMIEQLEDSEGIIKGILLNNIGRAHLDLAMMSTSKEQAINNLERSIYYYSAALELRTPDQSRGDWLLSYGGRALSRLLLGRNTDDHALHERAGKERLDAEIAARKIGNHMFAEFLKRFE